MRVVLDTNVVVAALRSSRGASRWLLSAVLRRRTDAIVSVPLLLEYESVLNRPEHAAVAGISEAEIEVIIDALAEVAEPVRLSFRWRPLLPDANDDMVLETAINGGADLIVTFNVRDFGEAGNSFGCRVVLPREAVQLIRKTDGKRNNK
jgi:putative PIN family toxin of toxin-antitoxin system